MRYLDFDLEIGPSSEGTHLITVRSPAGQAHQTIRLPFNQQTLEKLLLKLQIALLQSAASVRQALSPEQLLVQDFGQQLFDAIVSGEIRSRYDVCRQIANQQPDETGVRVRLQVQVAELAALPWEFLYDTRQGEYLCLSRFTPLVRYLNLPQPTPPLAVSLPLRILCMMADPSDQARLDIQREKKRMADALKKLETQGLVELHWLEGQTWNDLHQAMWRGPWHIFHFIGHGGFHPTMQEGTLALANEAGATHLLSATQLTRLLADHRSLRLALLNTCEGARSGEGDIFSSTAATLAHGGIPAVLAMQYSITDRAAIQLTRTFYSALANSLPVDQAVAEVRKAISVDTPTTLEWGTPVLYMRSPDGILFQLAAAKAPAVHALPPAPQEASRPSAPEQGRTPLASRPSSTVFFSATAKTKEQWLEAGDEYARSGRFQEAIAAYEAALLLAPDFAPAHFSKGDALRLLNRLNEALEAFNWAIQLDPSLAVAYRRKGYILNRLKRYRDALSALDKAIRLEPAYAASYVGKGEALTGLKHLKEALAAYEQAIAHDPKLTGAYVGKGNILLEQHQPQAALLAFREALKLSPNNGEARYGATLAEQRLLTTAATPQPAPASPIVKAGGRGKAPVFLFLKGRWKGLVLRSQIAGIASLVLFISLFLPWFIVSFTCSGALCIPAYTYSESASAWSTSTQFAYGMLGSAGFSIALLIWLVILVTFVLIALQVLVALRRLSAQRSQMLILITAGVLLLCEMIFMFLAFSTDNRSFPGPDETQVSSSSLGIGFWIGLLATLAVGGTSLFYFTSIKKSKAVGAAQPPPQAPGQ